MKSKKIFITPATKTRGLSVSTKDELTEEETKLTIKFLKSDAFKHPIVGVKKEMCK